MISDLLLFFVPDPLTPLSVVLLLFASIAGSFISTAFGLGGGLTLLATMTIFLPPAILIPVHAVIQFGSIVGRLGVMFRQIAWSIMVPFAIGASVGAMVGAQLLVELPDGWLEIILGSFIVYACYGPIPQLRHNSRTRLGVAGAITTGLSLFVGATGPLVGALLRGVGMDRVTHVATFAACMLMHQIFKITVFGFMGFVFAPYIPFILAMIATGFIGTLIGRRVLLGMNDGLFGRILTFLLVILGLRLVYTGVMQQL